MSKVVMKKRMSGIMMLAIALAAVVFSTACSKNANTGNSTSSTNSSATGTTGSTTSTASSGGATAGSPTAALRGYYQAAMDKDVNAAKKYLSAGTMALLEEGAKKMGKSLDEAFKESAAQSNTTVMPEFSNEKITGDTATVEMKAQGMSVTMPMVKEGGEWKLAMDKLIEGMKNSLGTEGPKAPAEGEKDEDGHEGGH
jgi:flagellar hook-associated protein FlgK